MRPRRRSTPVYKRPSSPLDGSPFAEAILPFLRQIAGALDMELILLRVVAPQAMAPIGGAARVLIRELERQRVDAEEYLARLAQDLRNRGVRVDTRVSRGEAAHEILAVARETAADLIAMCTHDRSGFGRFVFGAVAEAVVRRADIPVLLLKPDETEPHQVANDSGAAARRRSVGGRPDQTHPSHGGRHARTRTDDRRPHHTPARHLHLRSAPSHGQRADSACARHAGRGPPRHRHRPGHPPQHAVASDQPVRVGAQLPAGKASPSAR